MKDNYEIKNYNSYDELEDIMESRYEMPFLSSFNSVFKLIVK